MAQAGRTGDGGAAILVIVAGPTASGKSALAAALARRLNGVIVNADAMQCYADLRVLTARPSADEAAAWPHRLYGVLPASAAGNAAWWRDAALAELRRAREAGQVPVLCGGTGMYLSGLLQGIAEIPDCGQEARAEARALLAQAGPQALHRALQEADPATAARLNASDSQRIARAWEVWRGTGKGLGYWQARPRTPLAGWQPRLILLDPPRPELREAITVRFADMLGAGALEEVRQLLRQGLDPALPLMRAHGVPELKRHLGGEISLEQAAAAAIAATGRYTRRQATWFRHQELVQPSAMRLIQTRIASSEQLSESFLGDIENFINSPT